MENPRSCLWQLFILRAILDVLRARIHIHSRVNPWYTALRINKRVQKLYDITPGLVKVMEVADRERVEIGKKLRIKVGSLKWKKRA